MTRPKTCMQTKGFKCYKVAPPKAAANSDNKMYQIQYYLRNSMFDQEQQKLLNQSLNRAKQDLKTHLNVYQVSAFDPKFDQQLKKLVIYYSFDFQAIALHLSFKFHQYSHRLKPQAVSYRWYQLTLANQTSLLEQDLQQKVPKKQPKNLELFQQQMKEQNNDDVVFFSLEQKLLQFQVAMSKARELDEQQNEGFMFYRPKFIMDSQFKLERQPITTVKDLQSLMENEVIVQFGAFSPPQTAPLNPFIQEDIKIAAPNFYQDSNKKIEENEQTQYLDDDWEAYQSD